VSPELPRYREVRPGPRLAPFVQCYWTITASATPSFFNRVCPYGCADIIVDLAAKPPTDGCHFREALGVTPKLFSRIVRFRRTLALMRRDQRPSWSRLAVEAGYYDQAHLIREVRVLSGATPAELVAETRAVGFVQYESDVPL